MLNLPTEIMVLMQHFTPVFSERTWDWVEVLVVGAILAPGKRTVTAVLRVMGLSEERQRYHRVLNRAVWSSLRVSQILLGLLVIALVPLGLPVIVVADETLERRQGDQIKAKSVLRDAARSSKTHTVTSYGLRWVSMALLVPVPWSQRVWALPFLTVLAPSEKTNQANGKRHKTSIDWIGQMIGQVRRWLPERHLVLVVDGGLAAIKLGQRCLGYANPVTYVARQMVMNWDSVYGISADEQGEEFVNYYAPSGGVVAQMLYYNAEGQVIRITESPSSFVTVGEWMAVRQLEFKPGVQIWTTGNIDAVVMDQSGGSGAGPYLITGIVKERFLAIDGDASLDALLDMMARFAASRSSELPEPRLMRDATQG